MSIISFTEKIRKNKMEFVRFKVRSEVESGSTIPEVDPRIRNAGFFPSLKTSSRVRDTVSWPDR